MLLVRMIEELSERERLSYLGGIIDGEGHVAITKSVCKTYIQYSLRIRVGNTSFELISWLKENFGGGISTIGRKLQWKDIRTWELVSLKAYRLLKRVKPFLIIKAERADLGMDYYHDCILKTRYLRPPPIWLQKKREMYYQQMKVLNKRGKWKEETSGDTGDVEDVL